MQMARLAGAARRLRDAGLLYLVCLMHPTTGGVLASWGSLGCVTWAAPGALLGFGGPRVVEMLTGAPLPAGVQRAENLLERGLIDEVVAPSQLRERVARVLAVTAGELTGGPAPQRPAAEPAAVHDAWASVGHARSPARPSAAELLAAWASDVTVLRGDRAGGDDPGVPGRARPRARHPRRRRGPGARPGDARRGAHGPRRLPQGAPGDGPRGGARAAAGDDRRHARGADRGVAAEEGGLSFAIAQCLAQLAALRVPTLAVLAGEGGGGGALALLAADRVVCAKHASLEAIAPEGASAILYRDAGHAAELAATQGGASWDLARRGIVDVVVPERGSADREPGPFAARLGDAVELELRALLAEVPEARLAARARRYGHGS